MKLSRRTEPPGTICQACQTRRRVVRKYEPIGSEQLELRICDECLWDSISAAYPMHQGSGRLYVRPSKPEQVYAETDGGPLPIGNYSEMFGTIET